MKRFTAPAMLLALAGLVAIAATIGINASDFSRRDAGLRRAPGVEVPVAPPPIADSFLLRLVVAERGGLLAGVTVASGN